MWENERRKTIVRNVLIGLAVLVVAAGLLMTMITVKKQIAQEDALLKEEHSSQRQELNEARQENQALIQQTYQQHLDTVAQYMPGIVCWGDSLTAGSSGNVSYPLTLQKYINTYLCDIYDLRYAFENTEVSGRINQKDYPISIPVVNMGAGQENSATILGRAGVVPYVIAKDFVIPAEVESVAISLVSADGRTVLPLTAGNAGVNPVTIAGVEGTITRVQNAGQYRYQFTRTEAGSETQVPKNTEIVTEAANAYQNYIHVIWMGTYDNSVKSEKLVEDVKAMLERQNLNSERYLVIGPCAINGRWANETAHTLEAIDSAMLQAFGNRYISLRKYLIEDGLRDAGLSATKKDTTNIAMGGVPDSFRSSASGADMNGTAYQLIGKLVYGRMDQLGYFDEIREALNLDKISQDLLKKDTNYFDRLLKAN